MLNHIHIPLIFLRLRTHIKHTTLTLESLHQRHPLLLLTHQGGRKVNLVRIRLRTLCLGNRTVDLQLCYRVRESKDLFKVEVVSAELRVSEAFNVLQKINLIFKLYLHDLIFKGLDDAEGHKDGRELLLRNDEIPHPLGEIQRKVVEEQREKPLKDPQLVHNPNLPQFLINPWQLPLQKHPKHLTVKLNQGKAVLVKTDGQDAVVGQHPHQQPETLFFLAPREQQKPSHEVQTLRIAHLREVERHLSQNFLKPIQIVLISEEGRLRVGPGGVLGDLLETGMHLRVLLRPCVRHWNLNGMRNAKFMVPHDAVLLGNGLPRKIATGLLAGLTVEEVPEVVGLDLREIALPHWKYYNGN